MKELKELVEKLEEAVDTLEVTTIYDAPFLIEQIDGLIHELHTVISDLEVEEK